MQQPRSERMAANADKYEGRSQSASDKDHSTWLSKRAVRLRKQIPAQERAFEHKQNRQKDRRHHHAATSPAYPRAPATDFGGETASDHDDCRRRCLSLKLEASGDYTHPPCERFQTKH